MYIYIAIQDIHSNSIWKNGKLTILKSIKDNIKTGWWFQPLWKILVTWDDDIPNIWKIMEKNVPNHQPENLLPSGYLT